MIITIVLVILLYDCEVMRENFCFLKYNTQDCAIYINYVIKFSQQTFLGIR